MNKTGKGFLASLGLAGVFAAGCITGQQIEQRHASDVKIRYWYDRLLEKHREHEIKNHAGSLKYPVSVALVNFQAVAYTSRSTDECDGICVDRALMPALLLATRPSRLVLDPQDKDLPTLVDAKTGLTERGMTYAQGQGLPATAEAVIHEALNNTNRIIGPSPH